MDRLAVEPVSTDSNTLITFNELRRYLNTQILGQESLVESLLVTLLASGHLLIEGPPGLAKTRAIKALSHGVQCDFQRIQFTPDMLPADLTGSDIYRPEDGSFRFQRGPLFHNLILADEINRAPAKVQSALLEAMAEHQISVGMTTYALPRLFLVMATQNPIEHEGTYPLPEAQLDRFMLHAVVDYPDRATTLPDHGSGAARGAGRARVAAPGTSCPAGNRFRGAPRNPRPEPRRVGGRLHRRAGRCDPPSRQLQRQAGRMAALGCQPARGNRDRARRARDRLAGRTRLREPRGCPGDCAERAPAPAAARLHRAGTRRHRAGLHRRIAAEGPGAMIVPDLAELTALRGAARGLSLRARRPAMAQLQGGHRSAQRGRGLEFEEVRLYTAGDDARNIDWRVTARRGRTHTKLFREERERPVWLVADMHPGLYFGSRRQFKSSVLLRAAAMLGWAAAMGGDRVGAVLSLPASAPLISPPRAREAGVLPVLQALVESQPTGPGLTTPGGLHDAVSALRPLLQPGSLVLSLSDFRAGRRNRGHARERQPAQRLQVVVDHRPAGAQRIAVRKLSRGPARPHLVDGRRPAAAPAGSSPGTRANGAWTVSRRD